jgi:hypothetical protein
MARIAAALIALALFGAGNLAAATDASDADETTMEAVDTTDGASDVSSTDGSSVSGASRGRGLLAPLLAVLVVLVSTGGAVADTTTMAEAESTVQDTTDANIDSSTTDGSVSAAYQSRGLLAPLLAVLALFASVGGAAADTTTVADTADTTAATTEIDEAGDSTTDPSVSGAAKPWASMGPALLAAAAVGLSARR